MSSLRPLLIGAGVAVLLVASSVAAFTLFGGADDDPTATTIAGGSTTSGAETSTTAESTTTTSSTTTSTTTTTTTIPIHAWVYRRTVGQPWGDEVRGLLTFRGNPSNSFYGTGPIPDSPVIAWKFPASPLCGTSTDLGVTTTWCGNGWTGQPVVWERPDGVTEIMGGAYDHNFHFIDAATGQRTREDIVTGDIVKGSPSLDPDAFPLVYFGSRDNKLRIVALDRAQPEVIWTYQTPQPLCTVGNRSGNGTTCFGMWNDDWDPAPRVINDVLFASGENSIFHAWKLNRSYDANGLVQVAPEMVLAFPAWDDELMANIQSGCTIGVRCVSTSIESTPAFFEGRVYFGTSAGWVVGLDITDIENGVVTKVFDYWVGDDVDGSILIDAEGMLYVPVEWKRFLQRGRDVGQLVKLDPYTDGDPRVWAMFSLTDPPARGGMFSTPALGDGVIYAVTNKGYLVCLDQATGEEIWVYNLTPSSWSSPVVVDGRLLAVDFQGTMHAFSLADPRSPQLLWTFKVGASTIEATPAVWNGRIYLWNRDGYLYAISE
ncbi:MAG: PQQ-binding-like beta-propeller repeat protein [Acidimicrobiia bacterium]|nr:PQQ-binding-like beta-propeller repeat protein [Acidimicrobiia bacterium]